MPSLRLARYILAMLEFDMIFADTYRAKHISSPQDISSTECISFALANIDGIPA